MRILPRKNSIDLRRVTVSIYEEDIRANPLLTVMVEKGNHSGIVLHLHAKTEKTVKVDDRRGRSLKKHAVEQGNNMMVIKVIVSLRLRMRMKKTWKHREGGKKPEEGRHCDGPGRKWKECGVGFMAKELDRA